MIKRSYAEVAAMCGGATNGAMEANDDLQIVGVSSDTRTVTAGNLYIPLIGERFDGHEFIEEALAKGAVASLWQRDHGTPPAGMPLILVDDTLEALQKLAKAYRLQLKVRVVGITGSNGKTTTKDMTAAVLSTSFNVLKTAGNYNNHIGLPLTLLKLDEETEIVVLEMGMSGRGEIELLSKLAEPEIVIITNVGEAHLLQLGSREEIARAKTEIMAGLQAGGTLVYNGDEPLIERVLPEWLPHNDNQEESWFKRVTFGNHPGNDFRPEEIKLAENGTFFQLQNLSGVSYYIPVLGFHNVINALAAIAVGIHFGIPEATIAEGLRASVMTGMRIEKLQASSGLTVLNDAYNASPTSMKASLDLLGELEGYSHKVAVLGDMLELGPYEVEYHQQIGKMLDPKKIDRIYAYGPLALNITTEAVQNFPVDSVLHFDDKQKLAEALSSFVGEHDVVLVKGSRGMKLEQVVAVLVAEATHPTLP
ncbi:UDP-N-acetylmuramoyl-tripeptide--D-alanyl-D-alanine ligase [Paenibacillus agricola]|uniref:UDP-N-acetylmuramoyl-tripeptide--D-alanyl-D-alanine ligase n=1 Tax=Paenibacillus agricola TaxID=2716264 RepID=A0ABX0J3G3_9BACL|nr:UDP-N-acetylmuramoyl-tripeptide--D-alanyl-D-alanine ligase [Paenibacillus agricola]NHN28661.1 UDP-N-acetylmuramoyl-tripeptide--D-alanyl-D-alanine ligase [Paenibacillus agricola]